MDEMLVFRKNALLSNLCKEWDNMWAACHDDKKKLMELALMQQSAPFLADFCYRGKGLSKEYFKRTFNEFLNGYVFHDCDNVAGYTYGMFIDCDASVKLEVDISHFLWCDNTKICIQKTKAPKIYISNTSDVHLVCEGFNTVTVMLFDESRVTLDEVDRESRVNIYRYSDRCSVQRGEHCFGKVNEHQKELRL